MTKLKAYILSFKEDKKRRALLAERFEASGFKVVFVDAVRGSKLNKKEKEPFQSNNRQYKSSHILQDNAIGCALSHYKAWQKIINSPEGYGFVFEDDAKPCFENVFYQISNLAKLSNKLDIVSLANRRPKLTRERIITCTEDTALYLLRGNDFGAEAYFISANAARQLLNHPQRFEYEVDILIHHWWMHKCQMLHLMPPLFIEDGRASTIGYSNVPRWRTDTWRLQIVRRINRLFDSIRKRVFFANHLKLIRNRFS